jgi:Na+(H+)/acetate symporter ActP
VQIVKATILAGGTVVTTIWVLSRAVVAGLTITASASFARDIYAGVLRRGQAIPLAFFLGWLGTVTDRQPADSDRFARMQVRALTGIGAERGGRS